MNKIDEIKKQLVWKIKDASNTNTIFDTRKYLLYEDVIEILNQALTIPVVVGQSEQLVCSCGSIKVATTGGSQCPNNKCSSAN